MITQNELLALVERWPIDYTPQYRRFVCAKCGCEMDMAWHVHLVEGGFKREIHLCKSCGEDYGLVDG